MDTKIKQPTSFQFVTFSKVDHMRDAKAISSIRRHAMKDIGRERRKPKKKRFVEFPLEVPLDFIAEAELSEALTSGCGAGEIRQYWTELQEAFEQDRPPTIPLPRSWLAKAKYHCDYPTIGCDLAQILIENDMRCPLVNIFLDLAKLAAMIDSHFRSDAADNGKNADILIRTSVMAHQLLELRPLTGTCDKFDDNTRLALESFRIATLTVIGMIYEAYGAVPLSSTTYVERQHQLLSKNRVEWEGFRKTKLWIVYLTALKAEQNPARRRWFVMDLVTTAADMGNETHEELMSRVKSVLWIPELFDGGVDALRRDIERTS